MVQRTVVNVGVDDELDSMKRIYDGIEDLLNETSQNIAGTVPVEFGLDLNVIFFPQIGFLISIPLDPETGTGNYQGSEESPWDRIFSTASRVYYKDYRMRELDETLGDIYATICGKLISLFSTLSWIHIKPLKDKEIEIIHELGQEVLKYEPTLSSTSDICGELDW